MKPDWARKQYIAQPLQALHDINKYGRPLKGWAEPGSKEYVEAVESIKFLTGIFPNLLVAQELYLETPFEFRTDEFFTLQIMPLLVPGE